VSYLSSGIKVQWLKLMNACEDKNWGRREVLLGDRRFANMILTQEGGGIQNRGERGTHMQGRGRKTSAKRQERKKQKNSLGLRGIKSLQGSLSLG